MAIEETVKAPIEAVAKQAEIISDDSRARSLMNSPREMLTGTMPSPRASV
jgi:hypothetical protein